MIITLLVSKAALLLQWKEYGQRNNDLIVKAPINMPQSFENRILKNILMEINQEEVRAQYEEDSSRDRDEA